MGDENRAQSVVLSSAEPSASATASDPIRRSARKYRRWLMVVVVTLLFGLTAAAFALIARDRPERSIGARAPEISLEDQVAEASRIVVGTVTRVDHGQDSSTVADEAGDPYVLATIRVDEAIKGSSGDVVASATTSAA